MNIFAKGLKEGMKIKERRCCIAGVLLIKTKEGMVC